LIALCDNRKNDGNVTDVLIAGESIHPSITKYNQLAVIHTTSTKSLSVWYTKLKILKIPFIVRFYKSTQDKILLQGYGVRLGIYNAEYRAFDDAASSSISNIDTIKQTDTAMLQQDVFLVSAHLSML